MTDILEFIEARLSEDERRAQAAGGGSFDWTAADSGGAHGVYGGPPYRPDPDDPELLEWDHTIAYPEGSPTKAEAEHIADNDPAAALRRCAGAHAIITAELANLEALDGELGGGCSADDIRAGKCEDRFGDLDRSNVLRGLASFWSNHPDYRPEWAPTEGVDRG